MCTLQVLDVRIGKHIFLSLLFNIIEIKEKIPKKKGKKGRKECIHNSNEGKPLAGQNFEKFLKKNVARTELKKDQSRKYRNPNTKWTRFI